MNTFKIVIGIYVNVLGREIDYFHNPRDRADVDYWVLEAGVHDWCHLKLFNAMTNASNSEKERKHAEEWLKSKKPCIEEILKYPHS